MEVSEEFIRLDRSILLDESSAEIFERSLFPFCCVLDSFVGNVHSVVVPGPSDVPLPQVSAFAATDVQH